MKFIACLIAALVSASAAAAQALSDVAVLRKDLARWGKAVKASGARVD